MDAPRTAPPHPLAGHDGGGGGGSDADGRAVPPTPAGGRRRAIPPRYRPVLLAAALVLLALLFRQLATLVLALLATVILAIPLSAAATQLERLRVPRALGALLALLGGLAVLAGAIALVVPAFVAQVDELTAELPAIVSSLGGVLGDLSGDSPEALGNNIQQWLSGLLDEPEQLIGPLTSVGLSLAGAIGALLLVVVTALFMAIRPEPLVSGSLRLVPPAYRGVVAHIMARLRGAWAGWMRGVLVDMAVSGVLLYVGLTIVGLDFALVFAVLSAMLVVIPYFGAVAAGIPTVLVGLAESPTTGVLVLAVYVAVQLIEGNLIVPLVMSRAAKLHPALIAIGVVVVGKLFGIVGLFVAVPILSTIVILAQELWVEPLERRQAPEPRPGLRTPAA
jgi:predicted PurR-regulated permease PerM